MVYRKNLIKIGNSYGIILDNVIIKSHNLKPNGRVNFEIKG